MTIRQNESAVIVFAFVAIAAASVIPGPAKFDDWEGRIVGGFDAGPGQFPHQASLRGPTGEHLCGATIVNNRWVVSAAHCTYDRQPGTVRIAFGTHLIHGGIAHIPSRTVNHPEFDPITLANDISLVQSAGIIGLNQLVQPINTGSVYVGDGLIAVASGWGYTSYPGSLSENLQWYETVTLTNEDCRSRHTDANALSVFENTICTLRVDGPGNCIGDSGGPLIINANFIGVISWGVGCGEGYPEVYARIGSHRDWLWTVM